MRPRVLFIGNLADLPYNNAAFLRENGYDADILILARPGLFSHSESWVRTFKPGLRGWLTRLHEVLAHDVIVATASAISYSWLFRLLGKRVVAYSMGSDFRKVYFERSVFGWLMRQGFRFSDRVLFCNPDQLAAFKSEKLSAYFLPYRVPARPGASHAGGKIVYFCPSRIDWSSPSAKDTYLFIEGFARFLKNVPRPDRFELRMVNWGVDVAAARALVRKLRLGGHVRFLPFLDRAGLRRQYAECDAVVDQFNVGSVGMSATEAMLSEKPVFARIEKKPYAACYGSVPPIFNCRTADEIAACLLSHADRASLARVGKKVGRWARMHHSPRLILDRLRKYLDLP